MDIRKYWKEFGSQNLLPDENLGIKYSYQTGFILLENSMIILIMHGLRWGGGEPRIDYVIYTHSLNNESRVQG